jgi:hypothetical protein
MDDDTFTEMKDLPALSGTLNMIVSQQRSLYRPSSLSDSFAFTPENVQRANAHLRESLIQQRSEQTEIAVQPTTCSIRNKPASSCEQFTVEIVIKLSMHIALISVFETLFFFFFVSSLEDNGIQKTVKMFIDDAVLACTNLTTLDIEIVDAVLEPYINATTIAQQAVNEYNQRTQYNNALFRNAWLYVGGLSSAFVLVLVYARLRNLQIVWKRIILENLAMVILLALYEYMFFSTVIFPYEAISPQEIAHNAISDMQTTCGILK